MHAKESGGTTSDASAVASSRGNLPWVVPLDCPEATDPSLTGAKAATLASLLRAGLPVVKGFVITTAATSRFSPEGALPPELEAEIRPGWLALSDGGTGALVVRSSSTAEDGADSSMAGLFTSVLDVSGWEAFANAVAVVAESARHVGPTARPLAVLVQPMVRPTLGGVLFGADPVSGRTDRRILAAVAGGPDRLVAGDVDGAHYVLTRRGRVLAADAPLPGLGRRQRRLLCRLASRLERLFHRAQDIEWAIDRDGTVLVLQARPITALRPTAPPRAGRGGVFGPGPVAETFPDSLSALEQDLWVPPLRDALREALLLTGVVGRRSIRRSPGVIVVDGRVAVDLGLLGLGPQPGRLRAALDPRRPGRRLLAAWRVGRMKAAFPALAADLAAAIDQRLLAVPELDEIGTEDLLAILERTRRALRSVHGFEVLAGLLSRTGDAGPGGAAAALWALAQGRAAGLSDEEILLRTPVVLALVAPRIGPRAPLPPEAPAVERPLPDGGAIGTWREILRLRARWLQELSARAAWTLGRRLVEQGRLTEPAQIRALGLEQVVDLVHGGALIGAEPTNEPGPPLPGAFRLGPDGEIVAIEAHEATEGRGAGGGRGTGRVHDGAGPPPPGGVLVVRTLDPGLAPLLPGLGGLVAETGSVLSHLAILAREFGVPTAVAVPDATRRFPAGSLVSVDGHSGKVTLLDGGSPGSSR